MRSLEGENLKCDVPPYDVPRKLAICLWDTPRARMTALISWKAACGRVSTLVFCSVSANRDSSLRAGSHRGPKAPIHERNCRCGSAPDTSTVKTGRCPFG